jgi:uncharacterized protein
MDTSARTTKSLLIFFLLVFVFSIPLWVLGAVIDRSLQKDTALYFNVNLLWHASIAVLPMIAALILVYGERGADGVRHLLKRPFDYARIKGKMWYVVVFLSFPFMMVLEYGLLKLMGAPLPDLQPPSLLVPAAFVLFFVLGIGEELGWTGYALDPLQSRWTALGASVILGAVSIVWHLIPIMQEPHTPMWIAWHSGTMIPLRILMVWIYNNTRRSMFAVVVFHAMTNIGEVVWPFYGTTGYYDPFITFVLLAVTAAIVTFLWGPETLARFRYAGSGGPRLVKGGDSCNTADGRGAAWT